jgi:ribosomal protein S18 acetylase RimI-like enzyme
MEFWLDYRASSDVRAYPTIWRIRLLLTSRVWDQEKDVRIWENVSGRILGFAMLWRRRPESPYLVLDCFIHPAFVTEELLQVMLQWGDRRAGAIAQEQKLSLAVYANGFSRYGFSNPLMEQVGYELLPPDAHEHNVYLARSLQEELVSPPLPAGYVINRLQHIEDLDAYQKLYGFSKVDPLHQKELIESDEYCHLVVVNPDGEFAAYCEVSICRAEWKRLGPRIGWIDYVEVSTRLQQKGLGNAVLMAGLMQLKDWGADTAMLVTLNTNLLAVSLYERNGFKFVDVLEYPAYTKQLAPAQVIS